MRRALLWLLGGTLAAFGCNFSGPGAMAQRVAVREEIPLGGVRQTISLRGENATNPVLLFLHGGPGFPGMLFGQVNADLERDFTVVHWDQRGAGKSFFPDTPPETMNVEQFVRDTLELTDLLRRRFGQRKVYLVGHSWGSLVGALAARRAPERFVAYVGVGQLVDLNASERELYREALAAAQGRGADRAARELRAFGPPPYPGKDADRRRNRVKALLRRLGPPVPARVTPGRFLALALGSPDYRVGEFPRVLRGYRFSNATLKAEIYRRDLRREVVRLDVPVFLLMGRHDTVLTHAVAERYFQRLQAPRGKHLAAFENSDHFPHLEEPEKFAAEMRRVRAETWGGTAQNRLPNTSPSSAPVP